MASQLASGRMGSRAYALLTLGVLLAGTASAAEFGPFATATHPTTREATAAANPRGPGARAGSSFLGVPWLAYRALAGFQGPRCPHRPSCSTYALQAVDGYGPLVGSWLAANRLIRGRWSSSVRLLVADSEGLWLDPIEEATFWLTPGER